MRSVSFIVQEKIESTDGDCVGKTEDAKKRQHGEEKVVNVPDLLK